MKLEGKTCLLLYNSASGSPPEESDEADFDSLLNGREDVRAVRRVLKEMRLNVRTMALRRSNARASAILEKIKPDLVFNLCETLYNHPHKSLTEMYVAGWLELLKLTYTGAPPISLGLSLNKMRSKQIMRSSGIPVPPSVTIFFGDKPNIGSINPPFIVKPVAEDGSFGITKDSVVKTQEEVREKVSFIHEKYSQPALVEEFIEGREFTVALVGNPPKIFGIGEVNFSNLGPKEPKIRSYNVKWNKNSPEAEAVFPAQIDSALKNRIEKLSIKAFTLLGCRDYARIDMRVSENGKTYVLEVNPNPDISPDGEFGDSAKAAGITYAELIKNIAENALIRGNNIS